MPTYAKQKGKAVAPTQGRTRNNDREATSHQVLKGKAVPPTQGRTRNHPSVAPIPKAKVGEPLPNSFYANSRTEVHPKFARAGRKHD